jgi:hypothetical protein
MPSKPTFADRIVSRVLDDELSLNEFETKNYAAREMSSKEIGGVIRRLMAERVLFVGKHDERRMLWRVDTMVKALREALLLQKKEKHHTATFERAAEARRTGKETCTCGKRHPFGAKFYVTARDAGRTSLVAGPYDTHAEAIAKLPEAKATAIENEPRAHFYSFGTAAVPRSKARPSVFGK